MSLCSNTHICQHHFQSRENESCHVLCSSCPYFKVGVAGTVPNSHVIVFCSTPLVFSKSGVLQTVNGAAPLMGVPNAIKGQKPRVTHV